MCAPSAPNPQATIQQQTASNKETAIAQAGLNYVNQTGPNGSLSYEQIGTWPDGTPRFQQTTTLSPAGQQLQSANEATQLTLGNLAKDQSARLGSILGEKLDWSAQQNYLNDLTNQSLNPQWDRLAQQNEQSLINRGLRPGSEAYNNAQDSFLQSRSSAFNNANLSNFNSALQSQLGIRNQGINEISALAGGSQVQTPQFGGVNSPQQAGTDVGGIINQGYANQMAQHNSNQKLLGGLFDAGSNLLMLSDRRAKTDIARIGETDAGTPVYRFRYLSGGPVQIGYMAQDLIETQPNAVSVGSDGLYRVNYGEVL